MQRWVKEDRTLICLVGGESEVLSCPGAKSFYDCDLGFVTATAHRPMTESEGRERFGHLRLA